MLRGRRFCTMNVTLGVKIDLAMRVSSERGSWPIAMKRPVTGSSRSVTSFRVAQSNAGQLWIAVDCGDLTVPGNMNLLVGQGRALA